MASKRKSSLATSKTEAVRRFVSPPSANLQARQKKKSAKSSSAEEWLTTKELAPECAAYTLSAAKRLLRAGRNGSYLATFRLGLDVALTTDGSGIIASVFANTPTGAQNWASYASTFDEYRVLAMHVELDPLWSTGGSTQTFWAPIAHVTDRSDATALTGYGLAERYDSHVKTPGQRKFGHWITMLSIEEAGFISTTTSSPNAWIKLYSSGNSASFTVGRMNVEYVVQFRGLGIN